MKSALLLFSAVGLLPIPLLAQVTVVPAPAQRTEVVVPAPGVVVQQVQTPGTVVVQRTLDPVVVRQRLSIAPKEVNIDSPPTTFTTVPPREVVKTTKTTTVVETPGLPTRVYNTERNVVVVEENNQTRELPYLIIPVLFVKETAELLDAESRASLEQVAGAILEVTKANPGAFFDIEGHTSTDGTNEFNLSLSAARAQRIYDELTQRYGVPASALSAHGYGENYPKYPAGTEEQLQEDRRVLVVRTK